MALAADGGVAELGRVRLNRAGRNGESLCESQFRMHVSNKGSVTGLECIRLAGMTLWTLA